MDTSTKTYCENCGTCLLAATQPNKYKHASNLKPEHQPQYRLQTIMADFVGPFESSPYEVRPGHMIQARYVLVIQDKWSRYVHLTATEAADSDSAISALRDFIGTYGAPHEFASDSGTHFKNAKLMEFLKNHGVAHCFGIPIHPQSQGSVERAMSPL